MIRILLTLLLGLIPTIAHAAWPSTGSYTAWSKCYKATSQASKIDAANSWYFIDLADMPVGFWSNVQADGDDIRTTRDDAETAVNHKLVFIDTAAHTGLLAVDQPHGSGGATADVDTYVYSGNVAASSASSTSVWPSTLEALYMLQEAPTTNTAILDWTSNARNSTAIAGTMTSGDLVTTGPHSGLKAIDFDSNDRATVPSTLFDDCETAGAYTWFAWVRPRVDVADYGIFGTAGAQFAVSFKTSVWLTLEAQSRNSGNTAYFTATGTADNMAKSVWQLCHVVYNGSTLKTYVNGIEKGTVAATSLRSAALGFYIGYDNTQYSDSRLCEVGMYSTALSADQCKTMYTNETDAGFWVITEVTPPASSNGSFLFFAK